MAIRDWVWLGLWVSAFGWGSAAAQAPSVYRCIDAAGSAVYQQQPCSGRPGDGLHVVDVLPPSDPELAARAAAEQARVGAWPLRQRTTRSGDRRTTRRRSDERATALRCTRADGRVSYAYGARCPEPERQSTGRNGRSDRAAASRAARVTSERISLETACREIRAGRGRSTMSTYDRNLGRDPCS